MKNVRLFVRCMAKMGRRAPVYLIAIVCLSISSAMFSVMGSLLMKCVVDMTADGRFDNLILTIVLIVCAGFVSLVLFAVFRKIYNVEAKKIYGRLSVEVLDEELHLPFRYYEEHHSGELISKISYDLSGMGAIYGSRLRRVMMPVMEVIVFLVPMLIYCWQLTLCLAAVNLIVVISDMLTVSSVGKIKKKLSGINKDMTQHLSDMVHGITTIRMFRAGLIKLDKIKQCVKEYCVENKSYIKVTSALESVTTGCDLLCGLLFVLLGIFFVNKGVTTLGAIAGIYTVYGKFSKQFLNIGRYIPELSGCLANADNIFEFLDEDREPDNWYEDRDREFLKMEYENKECMNRGFVNKECMNSGCNPEDMDDAQALSVENISFSYDRNQKVIENLSFDIAFNECVAITGHSGCGKTTLSKLILGLYPVERGDIRINGRSIKSRALADTRADIAYVPQDAYLFRGTIRENIQYGCEGATDEQVIEAAKLANAHEFIEEFSEKYDTMLNEGGTNISGGQRQRIAIARAIISNAPIIILDEATSALDPDSETKVNQALRNIKGRKTIIMIAHRPSTIEMADRVICLDNNFDGQ